ncbi:LCP family protein [Nocardia sp. NBC_01009]|uniref:LCP family protein n=1 Tax=Nocardia sp. NBC_01009 TaxID=2975996 RepID=UPI0038647C19|nr:LCP family protein [Nocardia sp. NBC_01009]
MVSHRLVRSVERVETKVEAATNDPATKAAAMMDDDTVPGAEVDGRWPQRPPRSRQAAHRRAAQSPRRRHAAEPAPRARRATEPPRRGRRAAQLATRAVACAAALAVLSGTGFAWSAKTDFEHGFTRTEAIPDDAPHSLGGDMNILLIGLDTRKDLNGNDLPKAILDQLHAGDGDNGGYNANSLILLHIPADMKKIVAFSIPRDDYVAVSGIPGYDHAKIKEAYGLKKAAAQAKLINNGEKDQVTLERQGREAGRASIVQTVRNLVGVPIDRFAEISLAGFYDLATALGGVDVCLNHAVDDSYYSGASFPAGPQHLNGSDALAFVRQRHGLENGDLDRTHRQQAFLTSVAKSIRDTGTLTNLGKLSELMNVAHRDVVLSGGWDLLDFARDLGSAGSMSVEFRTLPVLRYDNVDGQDVNVVDPVAIKKEVRAAFGFEAAQPTPARVPTSTVDVHNASGRTGQAAKLSAALATRGYRPGAVGNGTYADGSASTVSYGPGAEAEATQLAETLGLTATASPTTATGHITVVIGSDFSMPTELTPASATASAAPTTAPDLPVPDSGRPVATQIGSTVPCVN